MAYFYIIKDKPAFRHRCPIIDYDPSQPFYQFLADVCFVWCRFQSNFLGRFIRNMIQIPIQIMVVYSFIKTLEARKVFKRAV